MIGEQDGTQFGPARRDSTEEARVADVLSLAYGSPVSQPTGVSSTAGVRITRLRIAPSARTTTISPSLANMSH
jgi:hypothetical protein